VQCPNARLPIDVTLSSLSPEAFQLNRTLLVVRFAGLGVEGGDSQFVDALFSKVERHEYVVGMDGFGGQLHADDLVRCIRQIEQGGSAAFIMTVNPCPNQVGEIRPFLLGE
jgi:hypothetical protein